MTPPKPKFPFPAGYRGEATIESLAPGGDGLARLDGWPLFVPRSAPGDRGTIEVVRPYPGHGLARWLSLDEPSPVRRPDPCPHVKACGGCDWPNIPDDVAAEWKVRLFRETLRRVARWDEAEAVDLPIESFPPRYRLRSQLKVGRGVAGPVVGFYAPGTRRPFDLAGCEVVSPTTLALAAELRAALAGCEILPEEVELVESPDGGERALRALGERIAPGLGEIADRLAPLARGAIALDTVTGERVSRGEPWVTIPVKGVPHRVSVEAFFQVNRFALDTFVSRVEEMFPHRVDLAWDLYCGGGFFSFPLARRAARVVAVEAEGASLADARATAERIGERRIDFRAVPVERFLAGGGARPDLVVVDPPRAGMTRAARERLVASEAPTIVSVSCDAATFARDLRVFLDAGWRVDGIRLLDLFPGTWRVESIARLVRAAG